MQRDIAGILSMKIENVADLRTAIRSVATCFSSHEKVPGVILPADTVDILIDRFLQHEVNDDLAIKKAFHILLRFTLMCMSRCLRVVYEEGGIEATVPRERIDGFCSEIWDCKDLQSASQAYELGLKTIAGAIQRGTRTGPLYLKTPAHLQYTNPVANALFQGFFDHLYMNNPEVKQRNAKFQDEAVEAQKELIAVIKSHMKFIEEQHTAEQSEVDRKGEDERVKKEQATVQLLKTLQDQRALLEQQFAKLQDEIDEIVQRTDANDWEQNATIEDCIAEQQQIRRQIEQIDASLRNVV